MMGRRPDSTLDQRNIVFRLLTVDMMNKQIASHFQACECTIFSLRTKIYQMGNVKNRHHADRPRKTTRREDIDNVISFRRNRFFSSARMSGLVNQRTNGPVNAHLISWQSTKHTKPGKYMVKKWP